MGRRQLHFYTARLCLKGLLPGRGGGDGKGKRVEGRRAKRDVRGNSSVGVGVAYDQSVLKRRKKQNVWRGRGVGGYKIRLQGEDRAKGSIV